MAGLPTETDEDIAALIRPGDPGSHRFPRGVSVNISPFVPKAPYPLLGARAGPQGSQAPAGCLSRKGCAGAGVRPRSDSPEWAAVQAQLALGDERLAAVLVGLQRPTLPGLARRVERGRPEPAQYLEGRRCRGFHCPGT